MIIGLRLSTLPYLVLVVDYRNSHLFSLYVLMYVMCQCLLYSV